jgi:hypothetical protein
MGRPRSPRGEDAFSRWEDRGLPWRDPYSSPADYFDASFSPSALASAASSGEMFVKSDIS